MLENNSQHIACKHIDLPAVNNPLGTYVMHEFLQELATLALAIAVILAVKPNLVGVTLFLVAVGVYLAKNPGDGPPELG